MLSRRVFLRQLAAMAAGILASHKPGHGGVTGHARVTWAEFQIAVGGGGSGGAFQVDAFQANAFQVG